jgi:hypothetical protein
MKGKKFYAVISLKDPAPFLTELKAGIVFSIKSMFTKKDKINK